MYNICNHVHAGCVFGTMEFRQKVVIARTNLGLFEEMAKVLKSPGGDRKRLGFVGVSTVVFVHVHIMCECVCVCVCVCVCEYISLHEPVCEYNTNVH